MDTKIEGLVMLMDQALELAQERLQGIHVGQSDPSSIEGMEQIISGLGYRRDEAISAGYEVFDTDVSLGLARAALEYDVPTSDLINKIGEIERYFRQHFVRSTSSILL